MSGPSSTSRTSMRKLAGPAAAISWGRRTSGTGRRAPVAGRRPFRVASPVLVVGRTSCCPGRHMPWVGAAAPKQAAWQSVAVVTSSLVAGARLTPASAAAPSRVRRFTALGKLDPTGLCHAPRELDLRRLTPPGKLNPTGLRHHRAARGARPRQHPVSSRHPDCWGTEADRLSSLSWLASATRGAPAPP
jgi:hypothetical protein